ncbi:MAG: NAD(P)/FAD-dependent oxidoreductase [Hellea sp.]|nr:NAD(P)/FAD-dependent oxidoreductase [Hellea sp.]
MRDTKSSDAYDVVIIGAGPAGTSLALALAPTDRKVLIVEQARFPRFHIGESLTGQCAETLESYGLGKYMAETAYPVKRGVTVHGQKESAKFWVPVQRRGTDGEPFQRTTWQVRRKEFDLKLLESAIERGAEFTQASADNILGSAFKPSGIKITDRDGRHRNIHSKIIADASGQSQFLGRQNVLGPMGDAGYDKQIAIFAHVAGAQLDEVPHQGNTHIFYGKTFHWSWLIPQDEVTDSLGVVIPVDVYKSSGLSKEAFFRKAIHDINPELTRRTQSIDIVSPVRSISNYSYRYPNPAGHGFICTGDSHGFLDPIFSFGVTIALKEGEIAAREVEAYLQADGEYDFDSYRLKIRQAREVVQLIIDTFWQYPLAFLRLAHFSHQADIAELFYGRFYEDTTLELEAVKLMRELLGREASP